MPHPHRPLLKPGGHAAGHLREMFIGLVCCDEDELSWDRRVPPDVDPLWWLTGHLDQCTDVMPALLCEELGMDLGSTYGMAAREIRKRMRANDPELAARAAWRMTLHQYTEEEKQITAIQRANSRKFLQEA